MSDIETAIVETMRQPVLVLEEDLSVARANRGFYDRFDVRPEDTKGKSIFVLGNRQWDIPELRRLLTEMLEQREMIEDYLVNHEFERIGRRTMLLNARRLAQDGHRRILLAIDDVTECERSREELKVRGELADKLIDSIREGLVVMDPELRVERVNLSFCELFGIAPEEVLGQPIYDLGNGQWDIPELRRALEEVLPEKRAFDDCEVSHDFPGIGRRVMLLNARRLDHTPRILLAIRDETDSRRHAEEQRAMVGELQHRVKNTLATVQSIAAAALKRSASLEAFGETFMASIQSLARAQNLLLRGAQGVVDLEELLRVELEAHGWEEDGRLAFEGPRVILTRQQTLTVAMVLHELATNALKYGAFAEHDGRLDVSWIVEGDCRLRFTWHESGVPIAQPPKRRGFGTRMIEESFGHSLEGECGLEFGSDGLTCRFAFPLDPAVQGMA